MPLDRSGDRIIVGGSRELVRVIKKGGQQRCERQQGLKAKVGSKWVEKDLVFCGLTGDYFNPNYLLRLFKKVLAQAGLPHMRFHDLRHSAATILLAMGIHPKVVKELPGHSSFLITMNLYGHVFPSMLDEVIEKWNKEFNV
ncbi:MAG TPA: site-specific integrase [Ktedonobacteraceae bacterium]